jgi:diguanylate cyclase (GGDEF)-like protein
MTSGAWLNGDIDTAALDGHPTAPARMIAAILSASVLAINFRLLTAVAWLSVNVAAEFYVWVAAKRWMLSGHAGSRAQRANYVLGSAVITANWSLATVIYWFSGRHNMQIGAILIASGQLVHAQAFAFRSKLYLAIMAGIPATTLCVLTLGFGGMKGGELAALAFALTAELGYIGASAFANRRSAKALREANEKLQGMAYFDGLTALANRRMFDEALKALLVLSGRRGTRFALLLIDLDGLKEINDSRGHDAGDALLVEVSARLRGLTRASDTLARIGGDEFAILMADDAEPAAVEAMCRRLLEAFRAPIDFRGRVLRSTPSIGVAIFPDDGQTRETLFKAADLALYAAKHGGGNAWRVYDVALAA